MNQNDNEIKDDAVEKTGGLVAVETAETTQEQKIDLSEVESQVEPPVGVRQTKQEIMDELRERYPSMAATNMPNKSVIIATIAVYVIGIAALIVALSISADWWIKIIIAGAALVVMFTFSRIYSYINKKNRRKMLAYAYEFFDKVQADYESGNMQKTLYDQTKDSFKTNIYEDMFFNKKGEYRASGQLVNDRNIVLTFGELEAYIEVEGEHSFDSFSLFYPDKMASNGQDKDGYARKGIEELYQDMSAIVNQKAIEIEQDPDEYL